MGTLGMFPSHQKVVPIPLRENPKSATEFKKVRNNKLNIIIVYLWAINSAQSYTILQNAIKVMRKSDRIPGSLQKMYARNFHLIKSRSQFAI